MHDADREAITRLSRQAFGVDPTDFRWREGGRVLTVGGRVMAGVCVQRFDQVFGGRAVPSGGLAWVTVAPEVRGRGYGMTLAGTLMREIKDAGAVISTVHPVSFHMWRRLGYEASAARSTYEAATADIRIAGEDVLGLRRRELDELDGVVECYRLVAASHAGLVDRSGTWWREVVLRSEEPLSLYVAMEGERVSAYVLYSQAPVGGDFEYQRIRCRELIWSSRRGGASLMGFLAAHHPMIRTVSWPGPLDDPLVRFFDQGAVRVPSRILCMTRLLDVPNALTARGYPPGSDEEVALGVVDPMLPENNGAWRLRVADGIADIGPASAPAPRVDVGTLAAMYTGWLHPWDAARLGGLEGFSPHQLAALARLFSGPKPWLPEAV
ncbi:MAG: GNAT family N-acetyltransferase [Solirubrobacteraceae bacterium]